MKNFFKLFGIIAMIAVTGFSMAACGGDSGSPVCTDHDWDWDGYMALSAPRGLRECQNEGCSVKAGVGDKGPAGGTIFYAETGSSGLGIAGPGAGEGTFTLYQAFYLEAAPADEAKAIWGSTYTGMENVSKFENNNGLLANTLGYGRKDTVLIVRAIGSSPYYTGAAALLCYNKTLNGFDDWFLPSYAELKEMYKAKGKTNIPTTGFYWSSSYDSSYPVFVWGVDFDGNVERDQYTATNNVRAIRAF
jgi:hypothetical protein